MEKLARRAALRRAGEEDFECLAGNTTSGPMTRSHRTWIVIADAGRARIFLHEDRARGLQPVADGALENPDAHTPTRELGTDRPGRSVESVGGARHAQEPRVDWHRQAEAAFTKRVAEHVEAAAGADRFDRLIIAAPPTMLGDLRQVFGPQTRERLTGELNKDLTKTPIAELADHLRDLIGR